VEITLFSISAIILFSAKVIIPNSLILKKDDELRGKNYTASFATKLFQPNPSLGYPSLSILTSRQSMAIFAAQHFHISENKNIPYPSTPCFSLM
jgi:hypothetical protein